MNPSRTTPPARIGPNAIIRLGEALEQHFGRDRLIQVFTTADLGQYIDAPPHDMVDEEEVSRLHHALRATMPGDAAAEVSQLAGSLTADYLLAHRIPRGAQRVLRALPASLAARALLSAIAQHSWTFSGSGIFTCKRAHPVEISITGCPICRDSASTGPVCHYYTATFHRLFATLVSSAARVVEIRCQANHCPSCTFQVRWK